MIRKGPGGYGNLRHSFLAGDGSGNVGLGTPSRRVVRHGMSRGLTKWCERCGHMAHKCICKKEERDGEVEQS